MSRPYRTSVGAIATACFVCLPAHAGTDTWLDLTDETGLRSNVAAALFASDPEEKDYAFGDVDMDDDIDLVIVRKQPFTSQGKRRNVFLMNENGILVDRTAEYASASDVPGDEGFLTPTNDRDVQLADLNGDGWLDIVTAPTLTDNQAKHLSHPRIYINLGEDGSGNWLGWEYQDARIPQMHPNAGPRFCSVAVGDVTGDDSPDLYFGDYDSGGFQIFDFNNRLFVNDGNGFFSDQTTGRLSSTMTQSAFGASSVIVDINGDGVNDVVKQTSLASPTHVAVTYNDVSNEGNFVSYDVVDGGATYFVEVGELNNDGKPDLVVADDFLDKFWLNTGNNGAGEANFTQHTLSGTSDFGGNILIEDLDGDSWNDIIITDVDVDAPGCSRTTFVRRNLGGPIGGVVSFQEEGDSIPGPVSNRQGVHDIAIFDLNGDGPLDLIVGRCSGTEIYINNAIEGLSFTYLVGLPEFIVPDEVFQVRVKVQGSGGLEPLEDTGKMFVSANGGPFEFVEMTHLGTNNYRVDLPASACSTSLDYYFESETTTGGSFRDPPSAPADSFHTVAALGIDLDRNTFEDSDDTSGWTVDNAVGDNGGWERVDPNGTTYFGETAAPENDATQSAEAVKAFVTQNGDPGVTDATLSDIDGGPHRLTSPAFDLADTDGLITYERWFFSESGVTDTLTVEISNDDGDNWTLVEELDSNTSGWESFSFTISDFVTPTANVRMRFTAIDDPNDSVTEAGLDDFSVERFICSDEPSCATDTNGDGATDVDDLVAAIIAWGTDDPDADVDGSGEVDVDDLVAIILAWGPCV